MRKVRAITPGFGPLEPGGEHQRIRPGQEFHVAGNMTGKWFEDVDPPAAKRGRPAKTDEPPAVE